MSTEKQKHDTVKFYAKIVLIILIISIVLNIFMIKLS